MRPKRCQGRRKAHTLSAQQQNFWQDKVKINALLQVPHHRASPGWKSLIAWPTTGLSLNSRFSGCFLYIFLIKNQIKNHILCTTHIEWPRAQHAHCLLNRVNSGSCSS